MKSSLISLNQNSEQSKSVMLVSDIDLGWGQYVMLRCMADYIS